MIFLWSQVGFSMVLLSAAIKGVPATPSRRPGSTVRTSGRSSAGWSCRRSWRTVITVFVTVAIGVMKIFDIVYVMTNGNFNTNVIGTEFFNQLFTNFNNGYAAAIVVILMIAVIPIMIYQVRQLPGSRRHRDDQHGRPPATTAAAADKRRAAKRPDGDVEPAKAGWVVKTVRGRHLLPVDRAHDRR